MASFAKFTLGLYLLRAIPTALAKGICLIKENSSFRFTYCNSKYEKCCDEGCCPLVMVYPGPAPWTWLWIALIVLGYVFFAFRYFYKKFYSSKNRGVNTTPSINITGVGNSQPQELSLMLSFNHQRDGLERLHFDNFGNAVPTTPITPPPPYLTPTPPPTYNVAVHFPPVFPSAKVEGRKENT